MSEGSKIQWTHHTVNIVIGCNKVDELCANCYADEMDERRFSKTLPGHSKEAPIRHFGLKAPRYLRINEASKDLIRLNRKARIAGRIDKVFINSLSDTFEGRDDLNPAREALFAMVSACENLFFQLLTKRPENVTKMVPWKWLTDWPRNTIMMTSVGNQRTANLRIPELLKIPAGLRGISYEPALGPVDFNQWINNPYESKVAWIDWIIVGGESGPKARPFNIEWARSTVAQCRAAGVACFVKQLGAVIQDRNDAGFEGDEGEWPMDTHTDDNYFDPGVYQGKPVRVLLKDKKGGDMAEWPEDLRVREFPSIGGRVE